MFLLCVLAVFVSALMFFVVLQGSRFLGVLFLFYKKEGVFEQLFYVVLLLVVGCFSLMESALLGCF